MLQNPRYFILRALEIAEAPGSDCRMDHLHEKDTREIDEDQESGKLTNATQILGIVSVLVATVTFAAAFTLPGGYRADGAPNLAGSYLFNAFVVAVALAFICSLLATSGLIYAGFPSVDYSIRARYSDGSNDLMQSSVRSLGVAFALAVYLEMAPVAHKTAIAVCAIVGVGLLLQNFEIRQAIALANTIRIRLGLRAAPIYPIFDGILQKFWSLLIIFALPAFWRIHRNK